MAIDAGDIGFVVGVFLDSPAFDQPAEGPAKI
jgi:hypothetical protein